MRNISKRIKGSVVAVLFLSIVTVFLFNVFGSGNFFVLASAHGANAETAAEGSALDTDVILGSSWTIRDYPEQLHATQASVKATVNSASGFMLDGLSEDDPIVNIVPKEYFFTAGNVLQMGDEYGYFIDTEETL